MTSVFGIVALGFGLGLITKFLHSYLCKNEANKSMQAAGVSNKVLFFPDREFPCDMVVKRLILGLPYENACPNPSCRKLHGGPYETPSSFIQFLAHIANANETVDVCVYLFTQAVVADILLALHQSGVLVRIIIDNSEDDTSASQIKSLSQAGIPIKSNKRKTGALMHHKYVIIDGATLIFGSFNWTNKAVVSNYEAVIVSSDVRVLSSFRANFESLWNLFYDHTQNFAHPSQKIYNSVTKRVR